MKLYQHQVEAVEDIKLRKKTILADDMGLGKTLTVLKAIMDERVQGDRILIIAPKTLIINWIREFTKWGYDDIRICNLMQGDTLDNMGDLIYGESDVYLCTYESLKKYLNQIKRLDWDFVVCDEAHKIRNRGTQMHKNVMSIYENCNIEYLVPVTGTPAVNSADDLWPLLKLCGEPMSYTAWCEHHLNSTMKYRAGGWVRTFTSPKNPTKFKEYLSHYMIRRKKEEVLNLPPRIYVEEPVELEPEHAAIYKKIVSNWVAELNGVELNVFNIVSLITRCKQLCVSPSLITGSGELEGAKIDRTIEIIEEATSQGKSVLVGSMYQDVVSQLAKIINTRSIARADYFHGGSSDKKREEVKERFQSGDLQVACLAIKAGGEGITLTKAEVVILIDLPWTPSAVRQFIDRAHRIGQDKPLLIYDLYAVNTVEDKIRAILANKQDIINNSVELNYNEEADYLKSAEQQILLNYKSLFEYGN